MNITPTTLEFIKAKMELEKKLTKEILSADDFTEASERIRIAPAEFGRDASLPIYGELALCMDKEKSDLRCIVIRVIDERDNKKYSVSSGCGSPEEVYIWLTGTDKTINRINVDNAIRAIARIMQAIPD